jgi:hypothetical protein
MLGLSKLHLAARDGDIVRMKPSSSATLGSHRRKCGQTDCVSELLDNKEACGSLYSGGHFCQHHCVQISRSRMVQTESGFSKDLTDVASLNSKASGVNE